MYYSIVGYFRPLCYCYWCWYDVSRVFSFSLSLSDYLSFSLKPSSTQSSDGELRATTTTIHLGTYTEIHSLLYLMVMENKEPIRLDSESLPTDEDDLQGVSSSPTCQSQSHDDSLRPPQWNKSKEIMEDLELGMEFSSKESAYNVYCNYARDKGFDVRKHHWKKNNAGIVTRVTYTCSRQGFRRNDEPVEGITYTQPVSRVGCQAHMTCLLKKNGKFKIVSFDANHNHALVRTPMTHMLKINRKLSRAQKAHADDADKSGIPIKATMELMSREVGGRENLGFLDKDY